jgi:hypothetical protein
MLAALCHSATRHQESGYPYFVIAEDGFARRSNDRRTFMDNGFNFVIFGAS